MYGDGIGTMNVYRKFTNRFIPENLWTRKGDQDNIWRMGRVSLPKQAQANIEMYTILFEGVRGKNAKGKINA